MPDPFPQLSPPLLKTILSVWWFALGGCVGSFLNVVVYRLPAGLSISRPPSYCPRCKTPIRWHDNLPIFGWLILGGRCRDCRLPIAKRYPLVELITALAFLALGYAVALSGGRFASAIQSWGAAIFFLVLLCTLWSAALIEYDHNGPPRRMFIPAFAVGLIAPLVWPFLVRSPFAAIPLVLCAGAAAGAAAGWIVAVLGQATRSSNDNSPRPLAGEGPGVRAGEIDAGRDSPTAANHSHALKYGLTLVGLYFGWQAALAIGLALLPCALYARLRRGRISIPLAGWLTIAALAWCLVCEGFARTLCG